MPITKKTIGREVRNVLLFSLVSLLQALLMCPKCTTDHLLRIALFNFFMWIVLWKGNSSLSIFLSRRISWTVYPARRFLAGIVITIGFTVVAVLALITAFEYFSPTTFGEASLYILYGAIIVTVLISFFLQGRQFLMSWRQASFDRERFEKETIAARYEALKNQVSPHFLFNSLNTLSNLVYEDPGKAVTFIKQLSEVYRYVLETRGKELVSVAEELRFLESYLFLQRIRFGGKLKVEIGVLPENGQVAPLALQMLIENAIKHNVVSQDDPLTIALYSENGFLVVENSVRKKTSIGDPGSPGLGLANIRNRYEFLSEKKVQIIEEAHRFVVKLPSINL